MFLTSELTGGLKWNSVGPAESRATGAGRAWLIRPIVASHRPKAEIMPAALPPGGHEPRCRQRICPARASPGAPVRPGKRKVKKNCRNGQINPAMRRFADRPAPSGTGRPEDRQDDIDLYRGGWIFLRGPDGSSGQLFAAGKRENRAAARERPRRNRAPCPRAHRAETGQLSAGAPMGILLDLAHAPRARRWSPCPNTGRTVSTLPATRPLLPGALLPGALPGPLLARVPVSRPLGAGR
jgi:hypothetical protein